MNICATPDEHTQQTLWGAWRLCAAAEPARGGNPHSDVQSGGARTCQRVAARAHVPFQATFPRVRNLRSWWASFSLSLSLSLALSLFHLLIFCVFCSWQSLQASIRPGRRSNCSATARLHTSGPGSKSSAATGLVTVNNVGPGRFSADGGKQ